MYLIQRNAYSDEMYNYKCVGKVCIVIWLMSIQISSGKSKGLQLIRANETSKMVHIIFSLLPEGRQEGNRAWMRETICENNEIVYTMTGGIICVH